MQGVPRELIEHKLYLDPHAKPIKQQLRHFAQDKKDVIKKEIARLLDNGFIKCTTRIGLPILFVYPKRIKNGGYALIIVILIRHVKTIPSGYPGSIKSWTPRRVVVFYVFSIATRGITRFPSRWKTRSIHLSSLCLVHFVI
jgi:hypothetical protein